MKKARSLPCPKSLILLVEQRGIEPLTSALRTRRSAKLSYCPTSKTRNLESAGSIFHPGRELCGTDENTVSSFRFQGAPKRAQGSSQTAGRGAAPYSFTFQISILQFLSSIALRGSLNRATVFRFKRWSEL